jgi:glycosyltransferase involved in cell wall biosynthesis
MHVAVVVPAYQEAATIRDVAERALEQCATVIVVDDGSTDGTAKALAGLPVELVTHAVNQGKAASLCDGFAVAIARGADLVVTLDGDGQHRPEDIARLVAAAEQHPGRLILAARLRNRADAPRARRVANGIADFWLSWAAGHPVLDSQSGQRAYPGALVRALLASRVRRDLHASFTFESEVVIVAAAYGFRTVAVPIDTLYHRGARPSHFRPVQDIARIVRMVARHLVANCLALPGLWRSLAEAPEVAETPGRGAGREYNRDAAGRPRGSLHRP